MVVRNGKGCEQRVERRRLIVGVRLSEMDTSHERGDKGEEK